MKLIVSLWLGLLLGGAVNCLAEESSTNNVDTTASDEPTNAPESLGKQFTNSVGMPLIQTSGGVWAGVNEVSQREYQKVMGSNPSAANGDSLPVNNLTWNEAADFCVKMTALDNGKKRIPAGYHYALPTEDEWKALVGDAKVEDAVTSIHGKTGGPRNVGGGKPNSLGLHDVLGNVMEFVQSDTSQPFRILKGGSYQDFVGINLRPEFRWYCKPDERAEAFGLRVLLKAN